MALVVIGLLAVLLACVVNVYRAYRTFLRMPPGPPGVPILGNLLELPPKLLFQKLHVWAKDYGPIYTFRILSQPMVVITSAKVANDILDRMSSQTGDRPYFIKAVEFLTRGKNIALMARDGRWRTLRKAAHESLNIRASKSFQAIQEEEATIMLDGLLRHPEMDLQHHLHRLSASIGMRLLYGAPSIPIEGPDPSKRLDEIAIAVFEAFLPTRSIVDMFPPLKHIIARSATLRRQADTWYEACTADFIKFFSTWPTSGGRESVSGALRRSQCKYGLNVTDAAWLVGILFFGAQDTTAVTLRYFILAMLHHPDVVIQAQMQLDQAIGGRAPTFEDQPNLPYIDAIVKEVLRWRPPSPLSIGHATSQDIHYEGYLIPKGTVIFPSIWSMCRDPAMYPDGDNFNPSRFLDDEGHLIRAHPYSHDDFLAFGHGRRVCVGKNVAIQNVWICIAQLLWAYNFKPAEDEHGGSILPSVNTFVDEDLAERLAPKSYFR